MYAMICIFPVLKIMSSYPCMLDQLNEFSEDATAQTIIKRMSKLPDDYDDNFSYYTAAEQKNTYCV